MRFYNVTFGYFRNQVDILLYKFVDISEYRVMSIAACVTSGSEQHKWAQESDHRVHINSENESVRVVFTLIRSLGQLFHP